MRASDVLLLPLHAAQVATGAKSFEKNRVLGSKGLNARGLHAARVRTAMRMADRRRERLAPRVDRAVREQYAQDGFVVIEDFLAPDVFAAVQAEIGGDFERYDMVQGRTVTRRAMIDAGDLASRPGLRAARNDPRMRDIVRYVASHGGQPLYTLQIVLADASGAAARGAVDPQTNLHSDTFHPTAKSWLFLHDVGEEDGPFMYVPGSHRMTDERYEWETALASDPRGFSDTMAARGSLRVSAGGLRDLGYGQPRAMTVRANTLVVADTHGFHARSASPRATTRIEIYGSLRRNPFVPWTGGHAGALPYVSSRTNRAVVEGLAFLERAGLRGNPWTPKGAGPIRQWPDALA